MKQMKIVLMAIIAIVMGTTFTSCLDSDDSPQVYIASGVVSDMYGTVMINSGDVRFVVNNSDDMTFSFSDSKETFYPTVATIGYNQIEGKDYTEGKSSYDVYFVGYYNAYFGGNPMSLNESESLTPIYGIIANSNGGNSVGAAFNYLLVEFTYHHGKEFEFSDFNMYPYKWENNKLYVKFVHSAEVDHSSTDNVSSLALCFQFPSKAVLENKFPEIAFTGEDSNEITVVLTADGPNDREIETSSFKAQILY